MSDLTQIIAQQPQRQDSLDAQLADLKHAANLLGCYDAADWISEIINHRRLFSELPEPMEPVQGGA